MKKHNEEKMNQLGMPIGTASNRLRKMIIFHYAKKCGDDVCHQCGNKIDNIENLSIEHKVDWLHSDDPIGLFFDLENIAFSHLKCNTGARRSAIKHPSANSYEMRGCRCDECTRLHTEKYRRYRSRKKLR